jgi:hypothetical protein
MGHSVVRGIDDPALRLLDFARRMAGNAVRPLGSSGHPFNERLFRGGVAGHHATTGRKEPAMKFRNPWIDPRILQVRPADAEDYLRRHGWKPLGPAPANPDLMLFDGPGAGDDNPLLPVPVHTDQGADIQRMIEVITELALFEGRYAGDVLTDILQQKPDSSSARPNGVGQVEDASTASGRVS